MPRLRKRPADMGVVERLGGRYRAHVQYNNDRGEQQQFYGPRRFEYERAGEDLLEMRAAGAAAEGAPEAAASTVAVRRQAAMDAMAAAAERLQSTQGKRLADIGSVEHRGSTYRAHVFDGVERRNFRGPWRLACGRAEEDLSEMRAAGAAADVPLEEAAAAEVARRQVALDAMAAVARRLQRTVAEERAAEALAEEAGGAFAAVAARSGGNGLSAVSSDVAMVAAVAVPYRPCSVDADEPWQMDRPKSRREREEEAWRNVTGATHDNPTFGLDRKSRQRPAKDKTFTHQVLSECKRLLQRFVGERASADQIRELLAILPHGSDNKLEIDPQRLDEASDAQDMSSYALLLDYRKRIADLVSCAKPAPDVKRVVLKVIESTWASDVATGNKFFECIANKSRWSNLFKGLSAGDLFIIAQKGSLKVATVAEVASAPRTQVSTRDTLYSMLHPERHVDLDVYLADAATFDFVMFRKVHCPPQPLAARDLLGRIGAVMPAQWQGVVHISTDEEVHARLGELVEPWPRHENM